MEVPLDPVLKSDVSERVGFYWRIFGGYYRSIGVDKQTLCAALTGQAAKDQLFRALYDTGGKWATSEEALESYFYARYAAYEGVRVYRTVLLEDGTDRAMDMAEDALLCEKLDAFISAANAAKDFYGVAQEERFAEALSYGTPSITTLRMGTEGVSDEDFKKLLELPNKDGIVRLTMPRYYLVAQGVNMRESPEEYYLVNRADCLRTLKGGEYAKALEELCAHFRADENVAAMDKFYREWKW